MRTGGLLGACRLTARWRVLTLAMVLGMVAAIVGVSSESRRRRRCRTIICGLERMGHRVRD